MKDDDISRTQLATDLVNEGRAWRRAGMPIEQCPAYRIDDWADDWRRGWRIEDELLKPSPSSISLNEQIDEIKRELKQRERVYPRLVTNGKLRQSIADYQTQRLRAALETLEYLRSHEPSLGVKWIER